MAKTLEDTGLLVPRQQLDQSIEEIQPEICDLQQMQNTLTPILSLPPELLIQVFLSLRAICWHLNPGRSYDKSYEWLRITKVCRRWRAVALNYPHLWSVISLDDCPRNFTLVKEMLGRSKTAPLTIQAYISYQDHTSLKEIVTHHFPRMQVLEVFCSRFSNDDLQQFLRHLNMPFPQLKSLCLHWEVMHWGASLSPMQDEIRRRIKLPDDMFSKAPLLCKVDLRTITIQWASLTHYTRLSSLKLDSVSPRPTLSQVLDVLMVLPLLETLALAHCLPDPKRPQGGTRAPVRLDHLRRLTINDHLHECALIFPLIDYPTCPQIRLGFYEETVSAPQSNPTQEIFDTLAHRLRRPSAQSPPFNIRSIRLGDNISDDHDHDLDICLYDHLSSQPLPFTIESDHSPVSISILDELVEFNGSTLECFFATFELSSLHSIHIQCNVYKLPKFYSTCGLLPCLEEIRIHKPLFSELKDVLLPRPGEPTSPSPLTQINSRTSPHQTYFSALQTLVIDGVDSGYTRELETADDLEEILKFRHEVGLPIRRLVLDGIRPLRNWQLRAYMSYALCVEVDGYVVELDDLKLNDDNDTEDDSELEYDAKNTPRKKITRTQKRNPQI